MDTSRIIINTIDNSNYSTETSTAVAGYTVVEAPKGWCRPKKVSAGGTAKLKDIFGTSSSKYPELFEVEIFNKSYDLYVSAPYGDGTTVPVAYVTTDGIFAGKDTIPFTTALEDVISGEKEFGENIELTNLVGSEVSALLNTKYAKTNGLDTGEDVGDNVSFADKYSNGGNTTEVRSGVLVNLGIKTLDTSKYSSVVIKGINPKYNKDFTVVADTGSTGYSLNYGGEVVGKIVTINDNSYNIVTDVTTENDSNLYLLIYGNNSVDISESYVTSLKAIISSISVYWVKKYTNEEVRAIIIPKYPSERALHISFSPFNSNTDYDSLQYTSRNLLKMTVYEEGAFHNSAHAISFSGSLDNSAVSKSGSSLGFNTTNEEYTEQELVYVHAFDAFDKEDEFHAISGYPSITLEGGTRTFAYKDTDDSYKKYTSEELHNIGWQYAIDEEFSDVSIFFSSEKNMKDSNKSLFFSIASSGPQIAKYTGFIFNETPETVSATATPLGYGREYWNICNIAVIDIDKGSRIFSPLTGARALMQARIIDNRYGGLAPMWENVQGMGGQLTMVSPYRMKYKYTKEQLAILDNLNYNPVIMDRQYGTMVVGQRTCQSGALTDWSYIGHACAFMTCIKEIRNNVMIPQLGKKNNPYYRTLRAEQVNQILRKRIEGNDRIWAEAVVDTSTADGVNDVYARKALRFIISCKVKVDIFSEYVVLNFYNEEQTSSLSVD